jgi:hypothetical protein
MLGERIFFGDSSKLHLTLSNNIQNGLTYPPIDFYEQAKHI